jgi:hypothetical protein
MKYKLLVVDIDGTLLDKQGVVSEEDKKAVARAKAAGVKVSVCTGRAVKACDNVFSQIKLDGYHIFFDGALVFNAETEHEVYSDPLNKDLVRQLVEYAHKKSVDLNFYSATRYFIERETWGSEIRRTFYGLTPTLEDFTVIWPQEKIIKGTMLVRSPEEKAGARECYEHFKDQLHFSWTGTPAFPDVEFINILAKDVSKGAALKALSTFLKISLDEIAAIGDGVNDIPLLEAAGLAIAMDNAPESVKSVADYVTLDVDHCGVAAAIDRSLL